jgi:hypothetical protein
MPFACYDSYTYSPLRICTSNIGGLLSAVLRKSPPIKSSLDPLCSHLPMGDLFSLSKRLTGFAASYYGKEAPPEALAPQVP